MGISPGEYETPPLASDRAAALPWQPTKSRLNSYLAFQPGHDKKSLATILTASRMPVNRSTGTMLRSTAIG